MTTTIFLTGAITPEDELSVFAAYPTHKKAIEALVRHIVELFSDEKMDEAEIRETLENGYDYDMGDVRFLVQPTDLHD